jgi:hypothetical protein
MYSLYLMPPLVIHMIRYIPTGHSYDSIYSHWSFMWFDIYIVDIRSPFRRIAYVYDNSRGGSGETGRIIISSNKDFGQYSLGLFKQLPWHRSPWGVPASLDLLAMFFSNTTIASSLQLVPHVPQGFIWLGAQNFKVVNNCNSIK